MFLRKAFNTQRLLMATRVSREHYLNRLAMSGVLCHHFGFFLSDRYPKWNFRPAAEINEDFLGEKQERSLFRGQNPNVEYNIQTSYCDLTNL